MTFGSASRTDGRLPVGLERAAAPPAREGHREVPGRRARGPAAPGRRGHNEVGAAVAVGVHELHARVGEGERRRLGQLAGQVEPAAAGVAPDPRRGPELDHVGQPGPVQVDQGQGRVTQRRGRQARPGHRREPPPGRVETRVPERQRRQVLGRRVLPGGQTLVVDPDHVHIGQQRGAVERGLLVAEPVFPRHPGDAVGGVRGHPDGVAAQRGPQLEPGPVVRERVRPRLVLEVHLDQERRCGAVAVVGVGDPGDQRLIPLVPGFLALVGQVGVPDQVAQRVLGRGDPPAEHPARVTRIGHHRRVAPARVRAVRAGGAVPGEQAVLAADLPVVPGGVADMLDPGEQALGPRPVPHPPRIAAVDRYQVLRPRQHEHVRPQPARPGPGGVDVPRYPPGGLAGHPRQAQLPAQPERPVPDPGAVPQRQLRRHPRPAGRHRDRHREVTRTGEQIRREFLPQPADRPATLRQRDRRALRRGIRTRCAHRPAPLSRPAAPLGGSGTPPPFAPCQQPSAGVARSPVRAVRAPSRDGAVVVMAFLSRAGPRRIRFTTPTRGLARSS